MKTINTSIRQAKLPALFMAFLLALSACQKASNEEPELRSAINVVNTAVGIQPIAFAINNARVQGPLLNYGQETGYFITFAGSKKFDVFADVIANEILTASFDFKENTYHTLFITGENTAVSAFITDDDLSNPPAGKAKIRFVHLNPGSSELVLSQANGAAFLPAQAYKTASAFVAMDPGSYNLHLKTSGAELVLEKNITIEAGKLYNVRAQGVKNGTGDYVQSLQLKALN